MRAEQLADNLNEIRIIPHGPIHGGVHSLAVRSDEPVGPFLGNVGFGAKERFEHGNPDTEIGKHIAHGGHLRDAVHLGDLSCHAQDEAQFREQSDVGLVVAQYMRRRFVKQPSRALKVLVCEHVLPGNVDVIEENDTVGLVEPPGQGIIQFAGCILFK